MHEKCDSASLGGDEKFCKQGPVMANILSMENFSPLSQNGPDGIDCYNNAQCSR